MNEANNPELHINEEPQNDFLTVAVGFASMFIGMTVIVILASIIEFLIR